jgi:hypothetical protein
MAQGDVIAERINQVSPSTIQPQPVHFGIITAHAAPGAPTVLWDTALIETMAAADDASLNLDVIENASGANVTAFTGKTVLRIAPAGDEPGDPSGGTSREFVATVVSIYKRTPLGDTPGSGDDYLLVKSGGLYFEDLATQFTPITV